MKAFKFSLVFMLIGLNLANAEEALSKKEVHLLLLETAEEIIQNRLSEDGPIFVELLNTCIKELKLPETLDNLTRKQKMSLAKKFIIGYMDLMTANLNDEDREQLERLKKEVLDLPDSTPLNDLSDAQKIHLYKAIWDDVAKQIQAIITENEQVREKARNDRKAKP